MGQHTNFRHNGKTTNPKDNLHAQPALLRHPRMHIWTQAIHYSLPLKSAGVLCQVFCSINPSLGSSAKSPWEAQPISGAYQQHHWRCTSSTHMLQTEAVSKQLLPASQVLQPIIDLSDLQLLGPSFFKSQTYILIPKRLICATIIPRKCFFVPQSSGW